jgi:PAS domain-containing protein
MTSTFADAPTEPQAARPTTPSRLAQPSSLKAAVAAVNDHCLRTELRRLARAHEATLARGRVQVTVPRTAYDAMHRQVVAATALRRLVEQGPLIVLPFDASAPHAVREASDALSRALGRPSASVLGSALTQLFMPADAARLQRALRDDQAAGTTLLLQLRGADGNGVPCCLHLLPPDGAQGALRWACLMRLPHDESAAERAIRRTLPKPVMRPRPDVWPQPPSQPAL